MSLTPSQIEAQALATKLDALRAQAQQMAARFDDAAFIQVAGLLEIAWVTAVNRMHSDQPAEPPGEFADRVRLLEGRGCAVLRRA